MAPTLTARRSWPSCPTVAAVLAAADGRRIVTCTGRWCAATARRIVMITAGDRERTIVDASTEATLMPSRLRRAPAGHTARVGAAGGQPVPMTLEGTNTWLLRAPGAETCVVVDPGETTPRTWTGWPRRPGGAGAAHPPPPRPRRRGTPLRRADRRAGTGPGPVARARFRGAGRRRGGGGRRACELHVLRTPGHTSDSLSFLLDGPGSRPGGAHRRHDPRPRHHRDRPPGRRAGPLPDSLRRLAGLAGHRRAARARAGAARRRRGGARTTWRTASSGSTRCGRRWRPSARRRRRARSSSWSTRTWTGPCGSPRRCPSGRSWSTSGLTRAQDRANARRVIASERAVRSAPGRQRDRSGAGRAARRAHSTRRPPHQPRRRRGTPRAGRPAPPPARDRLARGDARAWPR